METDYELLFSKCWRLRLKDKSIKTRMETPLMVKMAYAVCNLSLKDKSIKTRMETHVVYCNCNTSSRLKDKSIKTRMETHIFLDKVGYS